MLVIFGIEPVTRTVRRGTFYCPECDASRSYARKRVQRRFTLFFVAMLPLDELGEYIECETCRGTFRTAALEPAGGGEPAPAAAEFRPAVLRIMLLMMLEDGRVERSEQQMIIDLNRKLTGRATPLEALDEHLDAVRRGPRSAADYAGSIAPLLNDPGKEMVLKAAYAVAVADREVHERERKVLHQIGHALGMSTGHVRAVMAESAELARELWFRGDEDAGTSPD